MWENRKLASWVVFFLLSAMHFNPYAETVLWKVWLLPPKKTKSSGRVENREREKKKKIKKKAATCKKKMSVQCLVSVIEGERRARNEPKEKEKKRCSSPVEIFGWSSLDFHPKKRGELKRNRCLQHSAWLHAVVQRGHTHYLLVFPLPARCFTLSTSCVPGGGGTVGATRAWRRRLTAAPRTVLGALRMRREGK